MSTTKSKGVSDPYRIFNPVPATWTYCKWPADVYPYSASRGKRLCLTHRESLIKAIALTRIGREVVVMGSAYMKWLASNGNRVTDFDMAPNSEAHALKRGGKIQRSGGAAP